MPESEPTKLYRQSVQRYVEKWSGGLNNYEPVNDKAAEFHLSEASLRCLFCGNQGGKSTTAEADVAAFMQGTHPLQVLGKAQMPPLEWRIETVDFATLNKNHIPKFRKMVSPTKLRGGSWEEAFSVRDNLLHYADGGFVEFMSYEQDPVKFAAVQRDGVWSDEEPPLPIWQEDEMRLVQREGRRILTMTPDKGCTWVYDEFELPWQAGSLNPSEVACWRWSLFDNPHIPRAAIEKAERGLDEQTRRIKIYGEFVHRTGLIFEDFKNREPWVYNHFSIPENWPRWMCIDPHPRKNHAVLFVAVSPSNELWAYKEIFFSNNVEATCDAIKKELDGHRPYEVLIDSASKGDDYKHGVSIFDYYCDALDERGIPVPTLAFKGVDAGLIALRGCFQWNPNFKPERPGPYDMKPPAQLTGGPYLHISRQGAPTLIWQLLRYVYGDYVTRKIADRRDVKGEPRKKEDDLIDCLRYIVMDEPHFTDVGPKIVKPQRWGWRAEEDELSPGLGGLDYEGELGEFETDWRLA